MRQSDHFDVAAQEDAPSCQEFDGPHFPNSSAVKHLILFSLATKEGRGIEHVCLGLR